MRSDIIVAFNKVNFSRSSEQLCTDEETYISGVSAKTVVDIMVNCCSLMCRCARKKSYCQKFKFSLFCRMHLKVIFTSLISIHFLSGGIFFYWQAGAISYLREKKYPLHDQNVHLVGASAGALCATLTACDVDFEKATSLALKKARDAGVWERPLGLYGIWGGIIEEWLNELLPDCGIQNDDKIMAMVNDDKLSLLVTEIPSFQTKKVSEFLSKQDLIDANMASVHIPFFLNGKPVTPFRSKIFIDGSFLAEMSDFRGDSNDAAVLEWSNDPFLKDRSFGDAVTALSEEGIWELLERGRKGAIEMEKRGDFDFLL